MNPTITPVSEFAQYNLPDQLNAALAKMKFETPTKIQMQTIPTVLEGHDLIASAQTGSGKTAAFGIPAIASVLKNKAAKILVLAPTRELVGQIAEVFSDLCLRKPAYRPAIIIGGVSAFPQRKDIERNPQIIIATPGRLVDHLDRYPDLLSEVTMLVLDEADRMLEMGFAPQLRIIRKALPKKRQTLLFSATFPSDIQQLSEDWLVEPKRVAVDSTVQPVSAITQVPFKVSEDQKLPTLLKELKDNEGLTLVFARTKRRADKLTNSLRDKDISVCQIHGGRSQRQREVALQGLRKGKFKVMIATDIAARGIDVPDIRLVVNYDLPFVAEDYLHRIGRTARAGRDGRAICLIAPQEETLWRSIERLMSRKEGRSSQEQREEAQQHQKNRKSQGESRGGDSRDSRSQGRSRFQRGGRPPQERFSRDNRSSSSDRRDNDRRDNDRGNRRRDDSRVDSRNDNRGNDSRVTQHQGRFNRDTQTTSFADKRSDVGNGSGARGGNRSGFNKHKRNDRGRNRSPGAGKGRPFSR